MVSSNHLEVKIMKFRVKMCQNQNLHISDSAAVERSFAPADSNAFFPAKFQNACRPRENFRSRPRAVRARELAYLPFLNFSGFSLRSCEFGVQPRDQGRV